MRSIALLAALTLAACTVVVQPGPSGTAPAQVSAPEPVTPLEITLARPVGGRLFVQTNRPAYVAIFEITPGEGVTLMQPANVRQRDVTYSGMTWVGATWMTDRAATLGRARPAPAVHSASGSAAVGQRTRYVYALASDKPLALPDEAFQPAGMRTLLGSGAYAASSPAVTMRTIARGFLPAVADEMWAEDALLLSVAQEERAQTTVRVYCGRGTVYQVPVEIADRVWCPGRNGTTRPASPDSVLHDNGRRVARRPAEPPGRRGVDRVANLPTDREDRGNGVGRPDDRGVGKPDDRGDNGRKLGHTDPTKPGGGRAEPGRPEQAGRPATPADSATRGRSGQPNRGQGNPPAPGSADSSATSRGGGVLRTIAVPTRTQPPRSEPTRSDPEPVQGARPLPADTGATSAPGQRPEAKDQPTQPKPEEKGKPQDADKPDEKAKADEKAKPDSSGAGKPTPEAARDSARPPARPRRPG